MIFLTGGARSGKSRLAVESLRGHRGPVTYIATGTPSDQEMQARIEEHRVSRPDGWEVIEEPTDLRSALLGVSEESAVIVDCLTLWISNLMQERSDFDILLLSDEAAHLAASRPRETIVISNDVGSGLVPMSPLGRRFRDLQGQVNQQWAQLADTAFLVVAGRVLRLGPDHPADA